MNTVQSTAYSDKRLNCWKKVFLAVTVLLFAVDAYAGGGMSKLTNEANSWKTDAYTFIGVCAVLFMLWEGLQLWSKKIDWMDLWQSNCSRINPCFGRVPVGYGRRCIKVGGCYEQ